MRKIYLTEVAERLGAPYATVVQWRKRGKLPDEDGTEPDRGHVRPWWWEATLDEWQVTVGDRGTVAGSIAGP